MLIWPSRPRSIWLAGLALGALDGFVALEFPSLGLLLTAVAAIVLSRQHRGAVGVGGLLTAGGAVWLFFLTRAIRECAAFNASQGQGCEMPDMSPWLTGAAIAAVVGVALTIAGVRDRHRRGDHPS
jgi:hypothetical protein